jgi:hypothetical protein
VILPKWLAAVLCVLLAGAQAVIQLVPELSNDVANVLSLVVIVLSAFAVAPTAGAWIAAHVTPHVLAAVTAVLMVAQAVQQDSLHVAPGVHAGIGVAIVVLVAMGFSPAGAAPPAKLTKERA